MSKRSSYKLICTDAWDWLSNRAPCSIQAVVTDPPYGVREFTPEQLEKRRNGKGGVWRLPHNYDGCTRSPTPRFTALGVKGRLVVREFHERLASLLIRVLVPGGHVLMASQNLLCHLVACAFADAGFEVRGQVARVVKTLRGGDRPKGAHQVYPDVSVIPRGCWEPWMILRKTCEGTIRDNLKKWGTGALRRPATGVPFKDLIFSGPARGKEKRIAPHPSLKPQAFMREIVWAALPLGRGVILDPFMGAGSTIAASEHLGMQSIGLELDSQYFRLAIRAVPKLAKIETGRLGNEELEV